MKRLITIVVAALLLSGCETFQATYGNHQMSSNPVERMCGGRATIAYLKKPDDHVYSFRFDQQKYDECMKSNTGE